MATATVERASTRISFYLMYIVSTNNSILTNECSEAHVRDEQTALVRSLENTDVRVGTFITVKSGRIGSLHGQILPHEFRSVLCITERDSSK